MSGKGSLQTPAATTQKPDRHAHGCYCRRESACVVCGAVFTWSIHQVRRGIAKVCSRRCLATMAGRAATGEIKRRGPLERARRQTAAGIWPRPYAVTKNRIRWAVAAAIKRGVLVRPTSCSACGQINRYIDAHHDDYSKPLEVVWLCKSCHKFRHCRGPIVAPPLEVWR